MKASLVLVVSAVLLSTTLGLAWFMGIVLEFEYPYYLQIWQAQAATTPDGVPAKALLTRSYPGARLHWHMCSYCYGWAHQAGNLAHVQVSVSGRKEFLHFAFHRASHQLVPLTDRTASLHPGFLPPGDHLIPLGGGLGSGEEFMIPSTWQGKR